MPRSFSPFFRLSQLATIGLVALGCSSSDGSYSPGQAIFSGAVSIESCVTGEERPCGVTLSLESNVKTCFRGTQTCVKEKWSECTDGTVTREPVRKSTQSSERHPLALSTPVACDDPSNSFYNPCDPGCMYFDEDPPDVTGNPSTPPAPPTYGGNPTRTLCTADVCTASPSPLTYGCSPCVTMVCDADMDCCTSAWDNDCVSAALNLCAGVTVPSGPGLCQYGLYSDGSITTANRPASNALIGAYGDVVIGTDADLGGGGIRAAGNIQFNSLNGRDIDAPQGIFADGNISSQDSDTWLTGDMSAGGTMFLPKWGLSAGYTVGAEGSISGQNGTRSYGTLATRGSISNVSINGSSCQGSAGCYTHTPVELPPKTGGTAIPTLPTNCGGSGTYSAMNGATVDVPGPGVYRAVNVTNNGNVRLVGEGTYYFNTWNLDGGALILEPDMGGTVGWDIRVCGSVNFDNDTEVSGGTGLSNDSNGVLLDNTLLTFYADTSTPITMGTNVYFSGVFLAPNAGVTKANVNNPPSESDILAGNRTAPVNGAIWARSLSLGTGALTYQIDEEDCEDLGIPGTTGTGGTFMGPCPVTNVLPATGPALAMPCATGGDCQMNHRCVEPVTDPSCAHSKCATGAALDPTCDPCVEDICDADPSCCSGTWDGACVALVDTACDAVCGNTSPESGACTDNSDGFQQSCSGYDLSLGVPCDDEIEICNHGDEPFDGDVTVGYYADSQNQMALADPFFSPDGVCTETALHVGPGRCAPITCAVPAGPYTLMVDPDRLLSECDDRRADNWSVDDDRNCTPFGGVTRLEVEDFSDYHNPSAGGTDGGFGGDQGWLTCGDSSGCGQAIGWTSNGDYVEWTYDAPADGVYGFDVRLASGRDGWDISLEIDGVPRASMTGTSTGGGSSWRTIRMGNFSMSAGTHTVRLAFNTWGQDINYVDVIEPEPANNAPNVLVEQYEAECPDGTVGLWGLLGWDSDTPGSSTVSFKSAVADSSPALTALMSDPMNLTEIGIARLSPNTQTCALSSSCVVDITAELGLGRAQGQHLGLEITVNPNGSSPLLRDWVVTYSCVFDE